MMSQVRTKSGKEVFILTLHFRDDAPDHYIFESELSPITLQDEKEAVSVLVRELGIQKLPVEIVDHEIDPLTNATGLSGVPFVDFSELL